MARTENYLRQFNIVFWANKGLIFLVTVLFAIVAVLIAIGFPPIYTVTGTMNVKMKKVPAPPEDINRISESAMVLPAERADVQLETRIFKSRNVVKTTVENLMAQGVSFDREPAILGFLMPSAASQADNDEELLDLVTAEVISKLNTEIEAGATNFDISLSYHNPKAAARLLDSLMDNYVQARQLLLSGRTDPGFFGKQMKHYRAEVDQLEKQKMDVLQKYRIADFEKEIQVQMDLIRVFNEELAQAEDQYDSLKRNAQFLVGLLKRYSELEEPTSQPFPHDFDEEEISSMNERLNTLLYEYSELRKVYKDEAPKVREARQQIEDHWNKLMVMVRNKIEYQKTQLDTQEQVVARKREKLEKLIARNRELTEGRAHLERLERDILLAQENYTVFSKKYEEARIAQTEADNLVANVQVISRPIEPKEPTFPKKGLVVFLGILTGFLVGFALAYIREFFDHTFKVPSEVDEHLRVPVIGSVPLRRWL